MRRPTWRQPRARRAVRSSCRPAVEFLEDRLNPDVVVPPGFENVPLVTTGLRSPSALETLPDGRVFIALQNGTVHVVQDDELLPEPLIRLDHVDSSSERGLLGITADPDFAANQYVYVYYTADRFANPARPYSHNRLSRLTVTDNTAGDEQVLWELPSLGNAIWHMGGAVHFGPDGMIYVSAGDHQQPTSAQSLNNQFGKILRLDVSTVPATIPTDNPFYNTATGDNRTIWALGLRNPFTTAFQPGTGRFFLNDVGESSWEEVNAGAAGENYGWGSPRPPYCEGPCNPPNPNFTDPIFAYPHSGPGTSAGCAVTGGDFYNPPVATFPKEYVGQYFVQDFCRGWVKTLDPETYQTIDFATGLNYPTDLHVSPDGALWYITRGSPTGGKPPTGGFGKIIYVGGRQPAPAAHPAAAGEAIITLALRVPGLLPVGPQGLPDGVNVPGAAGASPAVPPATPDDGARLRAVGTDAAGATDRGGEPEDGTFSADALIWRIDWRPA